MGRALIKFSTLFLSLLTLLFAPTVALATTIVAIRTPTDIYVGADSKMTWIARDGTVARSFECKIRQFGKIFFVSGGPADFPDGSLSVRRSLREAHKTAKTVPQMVERFVTLYEGSFRDALRAVKQEAPSVYEQYLAKELIHVFFFGFEDGTPRLSTRTFAHQMTPEGTPVIDRDGEDCPSKCNSSRSNIYRVVRPEAEKQFMRDNPNWKTYSPSQIITQLIEADIKARPEASGGQIDILHLNKDGAKWLQNKNRCAEIQP